MQYAELWASKISNTILTVEFWWIMFIWQCPTVEKYVVRFIIHLDSSSLYCFQEFDVFWRGLALIFCCLIYYILEAEFVNIIQNMQQNIVKVRNFSYKFLMVYSVSKLGASDIELLRNIRRYYIVEELQMCTSRVKSKRFWVILKIDILLFHWEKGRKCKIHC